MTYAQADPYLNEQHDRKMTTDARSRSVSLLPTQKNGVLAQQRPQAKAQYLRRPC